MPRSKWNKPEMFSDHGKNGGRKSVKARHIE